MRSPGPAFCEAIGAALALYRAGRIEEARASLSAANGRGEVPAGRDRDLAAGLLDDWAKATDPHWVPSPPASLADAAPLFARVAVAEAAGDLGSALGLIWRCLDYSAQTTWLSCDNLAWLADAAAAAGDLALAAAAVRAFLGHWMLLEVAQQNDNCPVGVDVPATRPRDPVHRRHPVAVPASAALAGAPAAGSPDWCATLEIAARAWTAPHESAMREKALSALATHYERVGDADNLARIRALQAEAPSGEPGGGQAGGEDGEGPPPQDETP